MIKFEQLSIGFDDEVLHDLNGELDANELIALMGTNGAGKSCLLKTLAGLLPLKKGSIQVNGRQLMEFTPAERAKIIAVMLTERAEPDYLRVDELLLSGRFPYAEKEDNILKLKEITSMLKIENLLAAYVGELSDGQKQRVYLGRALMQDPQYLILDEPTTFLDRPAKAEFIKILSNIKKDSEKSVLFSTHEWEVIRDSVDKVWLIDREGKLQIKRPEEFESSGLFHHYLQR